MATYLAGKKIILLLVAHNKMGEDAKGRRKGRKNNKARTKRDKK